MPIAHTLDERVWRAFVDEHPCGNIFHTPEMMQVFARARGYAPQLWAGLDDHGRVQALLLPVQITVVDRPLFRKLTTRAVVYGSALCTSSDHGRETLTHLLQTYNQQMAHQLLFTELRNLSDLADLRPVLTANGLAYEEHLNFLIDLTRPQQEVWKRIRSNARRNVRKARKSGVVIEEVTSPADMATAYGVLQRVYKRIQVPLPDRSLFDAAFDILHPRGMFRVFLARVEGEAIGALTLLQYKGVMLYWYTGTLREFSSYRASDLLVWHSLELGSQTGFHTFDFGGGGKPDEAYGVRDFKAKFGGDLVNYGRYVRVHSPLRLQASQMGYQLLRRFL